MYENELTGAQKAVDYAIDVLKGPYSEKEHAILRSGNAIYRYAKFALKRRWKEGENVLLNDPSLGSWLLFYARDVVKGEFPEAEPHIAKYSSCSLEYAKIVIKRRFIMGEEKILRSNHAKEYIAFFSRKEPS